MDHARENGFEALVVTVDAPVLGRRERDLRLGFHVSHDIPVPALGRGGVTPVAAHAGCAATGLPEPATPS